MFFFPAKKIYRKLLQLQRSIEQMSVDLTALTEQVAATATIEQSAITLIEGIAARIEAAVAAADPATKAAVDDLTTSLKTASQALADAVKANTPVV